VSVLVVGMSHKSAPVPVLERAALSGEALPKLLRDLFHTGDVAGTFVISTCNRVEIYADVNRFHGSVAAVCELLSRYSGIVTHELTGHLYVHYEEGAVKHLLAVAAGLDSMLVGEGQILGQVRSALNVARENGTLGRVLGEVGSAALRTGKRAHAETGIDRTGASLVSVGIDAATDALGIPSLSGRDVLVVGAGSMSALAATTSRARAGRVTVANRTRRHAERLAASVGGGIADLADLPRAIAGSDLVISCTGAAGLVITADIAEAALSRRGETRGQVRGRRSGGDAGTAAGRPLVFLDLAMPRDVDAQLAKRPGVTVIGMEELADAGRSAIALAGVADEVAAVRAIVEEEFGAYRAAAHAIQVTPTVVALRAKAAEVVDAELARLAGRLHGADGLDGRALEEIARTVRRVVDKLLHAPTVRVKELAGSPRGDGYDEALRVLFDLDPRTVEAVTCADPEQADADSAQLMSPSAEEGSAE
jgi:glutamyl-tRNA reductase